jgi:hypothetical protein
MSGPGVGEAALHRRSSTTGQFRRETLAEDLGGGSALKALVINAINERLRTPRATSAHRGGPPSCCRSSVPGKARAEAVADKTLLEVRQVMAMDY